MKRRLRSLQFQQYVSLFMLFLMLVMTSAVGIFAGQQSEVNLSYNQLALEQELKVYEISALLFSGNTDITNKLADLTLRREKLQPVETELKAEFPALEALDAEWDTYFTLVNARPVDTAALQQQAGVIIALSEETRRLIIERNLRAQNYNFDFLQFFGILVTLFTLVPIIITVRTVRSINALRTITHRFAGGELDARANTRTLTELADLGTDFNAMAVAIQQREADLRALNETLEKRVEERTADLRNAYMLAQESAKFKSDFLSVMSHELRTPLNTIIGYTGLMLGGFSGEIDANARRMLEKVETSSQYLLSLINDLLDLSKLEAGRMELNVDAFAPQTLSEKWRSQVEVLAKNKNLALDIDLHPDLPPTLYGDSHRITQIVINLLSNAIKFTDKGTVSLQLRPLHDSWQIIVKDEGIGIPEDSLKKIFEPFTQVDSSTRRAQKGTGLGLAIVNNLVLMMNGSIHVTSEMGRGSTFAITLPLVTEPVL